MRYFYGELPIMHWQSNIYSLQRFNQNIDTQCPLCIEEPETVEHLFKTCKYMHGLWMCWKMGLLPQQFTILDMMSFMEFCLAPPNSVLPELEAKEILPWH